MQIPPTLRQPRLLRASVIALSLLGLILKLFYLNHLAQGDLSRLAYPDEQNYYLPAAQEFLTQGWNYFTTPRSLWSGPLNPLWIALWHLNIPAIKLANLGLVTLTSVLAWEIGATLFGATAGFVALALVAFYPPFFDFGPTLLTEPLFILLFAWSTREFVLNNSGSQARDILSGILLGLATLTRPTTQFLPFFLLGLALVVWALKPNTEHALIRSRFTLVLFGYLLLIGPYVAKNIAYLNKPAIANGFGAVLYLGNDLRKNGDEPIYSEMNFDTYELTRPYAHLDTEGDKILRNAALSNFQKFPIDIAILTVKKSGKFLFGYPDFYFYPFKDLRHFVKNSSRLSVLFCLATLIGSAIAVVFGLSCLATERISTTTRLYLAGAIFYFVALHSIAFAIPRMALPVFPLFASLAGGILGPSLLLVKRTRLASTCLVSAMILAWISFSGRGLNFNLVPTSYREYFQPIAQVAIENPKSKHDLKDLEANGFQSTGVDPFVVYPVAEFDATTNQVILVDISAKSQHKRARLVGQIFWSDKDRVFSEERSKSFSFEADGQGHLYRVSPTLNPKWTGKISQLRIDFANGSPGLEYVINSVEIVK